VAQLQESLVLQGVIAPAGHLNWWFENPGRGRPRWYVALANPDYVPPGEVSDWPLYLEDQMIEITEVYWLWKGYRHATDGSGGSHDIQVNLTLTNRSGISVCHFLLYEYGVE
jgi:hypothetical protein